VGEAEARTPNPWRMLNIVLYFMYTMYFGNPRCILVA
jgi:hypothetical protein